MRVINPDDFQAATFGVFDGFHIAQRIDGVSQFALVVAFDRINFRDSSTRFLEMSGQKPTNFQRLAFQTLRHDATELFFGEM